MNGAPGPLFVPPGVGHGLPWVAILPMVIAVPAIVLLVIGLFGRRRLPAALASDKESLASIHYRRGLVPHDEACYTCHSGYGIWGTMDAKMAGVMHMVRTLTGDYTLPIELHGTFDIGSCLNCHATSPAFRDVKDHQDPEVQKALLSHEMSCTGVCHPEAHPASALTGGVVASGAAAK